MAGERLTDGNPNIADLSDKNRPTKLAEMYSELYDNEWTNAYELLTKDGETEENACSILVKTLCVSVWSYANQRLKSIEVFSTQHMQILWPCIIECFSYLRHSSVVGLQL